MDQLPRLVIGMIDISDDQFDKLVSAGIDAIPEEFLKKLDNVAIVVEDEPPPERVGPHWTLLGLYQGVPLTKRENYGNTLPDKISIFKGPIERLARDEEDLKEIVKNTVWHEIAHHFGMDETRVREAEQKRNMRYGQ